MIRIGNRVTEKDVRDHLNRCGYHGDSANILQLELVAIERPGWAQVFSFHTDVTPIQGDRVRLYGVVDDDERRGTSVHLTPDPDERQRVLERVSRGRITLQRRPTTAFHWALLGICGAALAMAAAGAILSGG